MTPPSAWTPVIVAHTVAAVGALLLGGLLLSQRKGTRRHRAMGWLWVLLMAGVALSSFGIQQDGYSWIHGLSLFTLAMLVLGVGLVRRGRGRPHGKVMQGIYAGALLVTGLFTLLPYRLIGRALSVLLKGA